MGRPTQNTSSNNIKYLNRYKLPLIALNSYYANQFKSFDLLVTIASIGNDLELRVVKDMV